VFIAGGANVIKTLTGCIKELQCRTGALKRPGHKRIHYKREKMPQLNIKC
jgi:hypothetical protein